MLHIIPISGKDSLATALVQTQRAPDLDYSYWFNDTGCELPETYAWLKGVESKTGMNIMRSEVDLMAKIRHRNGFLPSSRARYCTKETKIEPMERMLKGQSAKIYYGLRADENRVGYVPVGKSGIEPVYPLQEAGMGIEDVYALLDRYDLCPPNFHWERLFQEVSRLLAPIFSDWESQISRVEKNVLFAGRSRGNCFLCFFQRQYEWVWLRETHFDLFEISQTFENVGSDYTWRSDWALSALDCESKRLHIFNARARWVAGQIAKKLHLHLFDEPEPEITQFSCGLLCGK